MRKVIVISCDNQPCFAVPLLVASFQWDRLGWEVVVLLYGTPELPSTAGMARVGMVHGAQWEREHSYHLAGFCHQESVMLGRRLYARTMAMNSDAFVVLSDADIIRLEPLEVPADHGDRLVTWNRNYFDGTPWEPRWPTCHIGGTGVAWAPTGPISEADMDACRATVGRRYVDDEVLFKQMFERRCWPQLDIPGSRRRLERECWVPGSTLVGMEDAHAPRDMATDAGWARCRPILATALSAERLDAIDAYRQELNAQWAAATKHPGRL
jgi:hypothetical protein